MSTGRDYEGYAAKIRRHVLAGTDMEVDVRFIDMMSKRCARVLDIGCGIGNAVNGLRARGHAAYGIDPTPEVLDVAGDLYDPSWFRQMAAVDITPVLLAINRLPQAYDVVLMSGNVPAFLSGYQRWSRGSGEGCGRIRNDPDPSILGLASQPFSHGVTVVRERILSERVARLY